MEIASKIGIRFHKNVIGSIWAIRSDKKVPYYILKNLSLTNDQLAG